MKKSDWKAPVYDDTGITQWLWRVSHRENFVLGEGVEIGSFTMIDARSGVVIEDEVKIGFSCSILSYSSIDSKSGQVKLGKGCKIGAGTVIMPGVNIGENAVIGSNSFVNRDVPARQVWFGTPAKFHRKIN
ncbi:MAG: acyltransferase [Dehalococcoidia bacterium]|jgi:UDP-2-acetamido-3-amino-2,3-dideoxy-glucuronate N-acetyltransferase